MKFLIAGGYDTQNLGDYASLLGLYKIIRSREPSAQFAVLSRHPNDALCHQFDLTTLMNLDHTSKAASVGRVFNGLNEGDDNRHMVKLLKQLSGSDFLVIGNGRLFVDIGHGFMRGPLNYFALLVILARFLNKPVVLNSVTLVHPETDAGKQLLGLILSNATAVVVREESSAQVAYQYIQRRSKVKVLPDIAFALTPDDANPDGVPEVFNGAIGINFRGVNYRKSVDAEITATMRDRIVKLLDKTDRHLVFCHQCTYNIDAAITDDRYVNNRVYNLLPENYKRRCHIFNTKWTLTQSLAQYAKLDYLFTERRHGFIMSLTQGTAASLICNEENSSAVMETIPAAELFLSSSCDLVPAKVDRGQVQKLTSALSDGLQEYYKVFASLHR